MANIFPVFKTSTGSAKEPQDIMKAVLQWYMVNPAGINDTFRKHEISFIFDVADNPGATQLLAVVKGNLIKVLRRYFPDGSLTVDVARDDIDSRNYTLTIDIALTSQGESYSVGQEYRIDRDGKLTYEFTG